MPKPAIHQPLPVGAKFLLVSILSVAVSWGLGKLMVTPHPVLAVGLLLAGFGMMSTIW